MIHRALDGFDRTFLRHSDRALCRRLSDLAGPGAGDRPHDHRQATGICGEVVSTAARCQGFRVEADLRNEKIGFKIREAEKDKIPYMLVVGDKEVQSGIVSVRGRSGANLAPCRSRACSIFYVRKQIKQCVKR